MEMSHSLSLVDPVIQMKEQGKAVEMTQPLDRV